jgi:uncharacterized membrane-anchored protein YhcB (DUF1043 family)
MDKTDVVMLCLFALLVGVSIGMNLYERNMAAPLRKKLAAAEDELMIVRTELAKYRRKHDSRGRFTK